MGSKPASVEVAIDLRPARTMPVIALRARTLGICLSLAVALAAAVVVATSLGPVNVAADRVAAVILNSAGVSVPVSYSERELLVVEQVRLPRVLVAALVGATLGISGAVMQGLFRNPLAEPGVVGVSSGAAVGAVIALFFGWVNASAWALPAAAFGGAVVSLAVVSAIAAGSTRRSLATLLLVGIAMNALLGAVINVLIANAPNESQLRSIVFWIQGGLEARTWEHVRLIAVPIVTTTAIACTYGRDLNVMLLGDDHARSAGISLGRTRLVLLAAASLGTATAVAVSGIIAFVGLVVPHALRLAIGPDHRVLLPASALGGATFLVIADLAARMLFSPVVVQVGSVTALAGAPIFLLLLLRSQKDRLA